MRSRSPRLSRLRMPAGIAAALMGTACALMGGDGAVAGSPGAPLFSSTVECPAMEAIEGAAALLASLDRSPNRTVRVLLRLKPGPAAMAGARRALDAAKAAVEPIGGRPLLVAELTAAQLRAVLASCEVIGVQPDEAVPPS
ncbi:hypothetical protein ACTJKJ_23300 [Roseateles sp. 22389]|uniref:hypothetical protein n=1 Tax=Roseateles sp. 22389 TaxID=3453916 RepID=UPI003F85704F